MAVVFIANRVSHKFEEIQNDSHVNVSFYDYTTTNWASYSGIAKISQDRETIAKHWSSAYVTLDIIVVSKLKLCTGRLHGSVTSAMACTRAIRTTLV